MPAVVEHLSGLGSRDTETNNSQSKEKEGTGGSHPKTQQKAVCTHPGKKVFVLPFHEGEVKVHGDEGTCPGSYLGNYLGRQGFVCVF